MNYIIETKKIRDKWVCFATIDGYDYSFEGISAYLAQREMNIFLTKKLISNDKIEKTLKQ